MKNMYKAFAKKLFGAKYEQIGKSFLSELILFLSLYISDLRIQIAPSILYLMTAAFTAGIMWQALSSTDNMEDRKHMLMLPSDDSEFVSAYITALGCYTLITKTAMLWAIVFAVSYQTVFDFLVSILCALNAVFIASNVFSAKNTEVILPSYFFRFRRIITYLWAAELLSVILLIHNPVILTILLTANIMIAVILLRKSDAYSFYQHSNIASNGFLLSRFCTNMLQSNQISWKTHSMWRYFFRYLTAHKNYLVNTAAMCVIACVLPLIFEQTEYAFILPLGFAILSMNTPLCILLSCDPALEQAVRLLPGQKKLFCIPYCMFIFSVNLLVDAVFLCSFAIHFRSIPAYSILLAGFFSFLSAVGSVCLEWFHPVRNWKIESDLWHHPRKYIVPVSLVLIAGLIGTINH